MVPRPGSSNLRLVALALLAVPLVACGGGGGPTAADPSPPVVVAAARPSPAPTGPPPPTAPAPTSAPTPPAPTAEAPTEPLAGTAPSVVVEYGESDRREIALTFDAGADRGYAAEILDLLAARGVLASFGILGQWAEANPDLVRRMVNEGHMLFNHSWSHPSFTGLYTQTAPLTAEERWDELRRTEATVRDLTGYDLRPYFRPPYGDHDDGMRRDVAAAGYGVTLLWSCDSRDSLGATAAEIMINCIDDAAPGRIVLLHVGAQSAAFEALPAMIDSLAARGFAFVTVEQLLRP